MGETMAGDLLLTNVRLPDGSGPIDIQIRDGRIVPVSPTATDGPSGTTSPPSQTLDGGGRVVLPRLIDAHMHLDKTLMGEAWIGLTETRTLPERVAAAESLLATRTRLTVEER